MKPDKKRHTTVLYAIVGKKKKHGDSFFSENCFSFKIKTGLLIV